MRSNREWRFEKCSVVAGNKRDDFSRILDCDLISTLDSRLERAEIVAFLFEKLDVYNRAVDFAHEIGKLCEGFPRGNYYLADQLNRASISIATNIAEGNGRFHRTDRSNFFRIARGSAFECVPLLEICKRKELIGQVEHARMRQELEAVSKMLSGLVKA